ncbi:MAG TPA: LON peptidase substrate-binding domain-containing protein [Luteimonas sp.]|nr:LON peptidase substrate-binding domain-containing protein [Luteimonas sp.]HRP71967.1 LON peptidase substrate-binding domain-containing protein [Luteimonas sp.]
MPESLPLFPLNTVLLPGAALGLRVFEPRYLDLVRECGRTGTGFGVCLIAEGQEAGEPAVPMAWGTEARIEDFDSGPDGLLHLRLRGARRFHVVRTRVRDNGLVVADVDWCEPDPVAELQPQHALLGEVLRRIFEQLGDADVRVPEPRFDDAAWVGWRLAELLPLSLPQRQHLLQEDDPDRRLDELLGLLS